MEQSSTPQAIAIKVQGMTISGDTSGIKTASSYIPRSTIPQPTDDTDWMSSSCGEKPFLNDDIRDWRHFRLRVRRGSVNDHLDPSDSSPDSSTSSDTQNRAFGDFYFDGDARTRAQSNVNLSSSVPIRSTPKFEVGSCPAVVINLPSLTPVSNAGSELMKKNLSSPSKHGKDAEKQSAAQTAGQLAAQTAAQSANANNNADDSIFDLEM